MPLGKRERVTNHVERTKMTVMVCFGMVKLYTERQVKRGLVQRRVAFSQANLQRPRAGKQGFVK